MYAEGRGILKTLPLCMCFRYLRDATKNFSIENSVAHNIDNYIFNIRHLLVLRIQIYRETSESFIKRRQQQ